ncbi:polyprenyl synthetase family protein, partial [Alistipes putredinis]|uniref:polyprenyl synthetase family protein n=1 Tax=Alistipes putredinis TaxID=28117 RepID=UPI0030C68F7B
ILARFNTIAIEVCEGQQYDLDCEARESVSVEEYLHMNELKTSALLSGATLIGAIIGGAGEEHCQRL